MAVSFSLLMKVILVIGVYFLFMTQTYARDQYNYGQLKTEPTEKQAQDYVTALVNFPMFILATFSLFLILGFLIIRRM